MIRSDGLLHGGKVKLSAKGDIFTSSILSSSNVVAGNISVVSTVGSINADYIDSSGYAGGGAVTLTATDGDIQSEYIDTSAANTGNVKITAGGSSDTGEIFVLIQRQVAVLLVMEARSLLRLRVILNLD